MNKIDLSYLQSISSGDNEFIKEMLTMFLNSTFPEIELLKQQANKGEWEGMGSTAHKMKAPIQMLGVPEVSALVLDIETTGRSKQHTQNVIEKVLLLEKHIEDLSKQITEILNT